MVSYHFINRSCCGSYCHWRLTPYFSTSVTGNFHYCRVASVGGAAVVKRPYILAVRGIGYYQFRVGKLARK